MNPILKKFNTDGFIVASDILDTNTIDHCVSSIKLSFDLVIKSINPDLSFGKNLEESMGILFDISIEKYIDVCKSLWRKMTVNNLLNDKNIINYISDIFGWSDIVLPGGQVLHIMSNNLMIPGGYHGISPHQDWLSVGGSKDGLVIWVPLIDVNINNYPLEVIPGSHLKGLYPLALNEKNPWEIDETSYSYEDFHVINVKKGDIIIMSYFTVHRTSNLNSNSGFRISASTRYDNLFDKSYISRTYPTAYSRIVNRLSSID